MEKCPLAVGRELTERIGQPIDRPDLESFADQDPSVVFEDFDMPPLRMIIFGTAPSRASNQGLDVSSHVCRHVLLSLGVRVGEKPSFRAAVGWRRPRW